MKSSKAREACLRDDWLNASGIPLLLSSKLRPDACRTTQAQHVYIIRLTVYLSRQASCACAEDYIIDRTLLWVLFSGKEY
jgi:hypothetical protein